MVNADKLKGTIISEGISMSEMADKLKVARPSLPRKIRTGVFSCDEIYQIIEILQLRNDPQKIVDIFFANEVT